MNSPKVDHGHLILFGACTYGVKRTLGQRSVKVLTFGKVIRGDKIRAKRAGVVGSM